MTSPTRSAPRCSGPRRSPEMRRTLLNALDRGAPLIAALLLLLIWEAACRLTKVPAYLLPTPSAIVHSAFQVPLSSWLDHTWATLRVSLQGYALAVLIGIPLAVALANSRLLSRALYPQLVIIQSTPIVAVAPIIVVVLGAGDAPRVVITFLITFFPIVVSTVTGLLATPPAMMELSRSLGAGRLRAVRDIQLPFAVPYIFSALRISVTLAIIGAVVAEFVAAENGLGFFIAFSTSFFKVPQAFAALVVLVSLSLALFQLVALTQRLLFPWSLPKTEQ